VSLTVCRSKIVRMRRPFFLGSSWIGTTRLRSPGEANHQNAPFLRLAKGDEHHKTRAASVSEATQLEPELDLIASAS
jgi:hypothetical protein